MTHNPHPAPSQDKPWHHLFLPNIVRQGGEGWAGDLYGGVTAAIIALPLALAFGVASGAGAVAGLWGAIAVGFFAAIFGGTPAQVSGPTGPMTVVMGAVIASHAGNLAEAFTIVMLGGAFQVMFGLMRLGRYIFYTPYPVVSGFMTGIGLIIIIIEILPALGLPTAPGGVVGTLAALAHPGALDISPMAACTTLVGLALLVIWPRRLQRFLPAPLAVLAAGTLVAALVATDLPEIGPVPRGLPALVWPDIGWGSLAPLVQSGFVLALLGSIDSLLTSLVHDAITHSRHDSDKELVGQGIGNMLAGFIGALPGAGATMRTVVNIRAGGRSPASGAVHALILLALALGLGPLVEHVPHAILVAILMKVGWDIIDWDYLKRLRRATPETIVIMAVTLVLTVFVDLITAVAVGIILAGFVSARAMAEEQLKGIRHAAHGGPMDQLDSAEQAALAQAAGRVVLIEMRGAFSFASAKELSGRVGPAVTGCQALVYDFADAGYVDTSAALAIEDLVKEARAAGQMVFLSGLKGRALRSLTGLCVLDHVAEDHRFAHRLDAIRAALGRLPESGNG